MASGMAVLMVCLVGVVACLGSQVHGGEAGVVEAWVLDAQGSLVFDAAAGSPSVRVTSPSQLEGKDLLFLTDQKVKGHPLRESLPPSVHRLKVVKVSGHEQSQFANAGAVDILDQFLADFMPFCLLPGTHVAVESSMELTNEDLQLMDGTVEELAGLRAGTLNLASSATFNSWAFLEAERPLRSTSTEATLRYFFLPEEHPQGQGALDSPRALESGVTEFLHVSITNGGALLPLEHRFSAVEAVAAAGGELTVHCVECGALHAVSGALHISAPPKVNVFGLSACTAAADGMSCRASSWSSGERPPDGETLSVSINSRTKVSMERSLDGTGFHRTLVTEGSLREQACDGAVTEVALVDRLSVDFFVDEYQVTELYRFGAGTETLLDHVIDLEKPAAQSTQNVVVSYTSANLHDGTFAAEIPLHYRYQTPSDEAVFTMHAIAGPTVFLRCSGQDKWLPAEVRWPNPTVVAAIPVGDLQAKPVVTIVTLSWTVAGASVVLLLLWKQRNGS